MNNPNVSKVTEMLEAETSNITEANLRQFFGTEQYFRHWTGALIYTDGIKFLADNGASWLVDAIASYQFDPKLKVGDLRDFQLWELKRTTGNAAVLTCKADSNKNPAVMQEIEFTDFPLKEIKLYVERGERMTLMLPSER